MSPKGQITIPLEIRQQLGIKPKDTGIITRDGDEVRITPAHARLDVLYQSVPTLTPLRSWSEVREFAREEQAQAAGEGAYRGMADAAACVNTNLIIRLLTQDHPDLGRPAYAGFKRVEAGQLVVALSEAVLTEVVHVLSSKILYNLPRAAIRDNLTDLLGLRGRRLPQKRISLRALDLSATTNLDFVDTLIVAQVERRKTKVLLRFDREFDRIPTITRQEP